MKIRNQPATILQLNPPHRRVISEYYQAWYLSGQGSGCSLLRLLGQAGSRSSLKLKDPWAWVRRLLHGVQQISHFLASHQTACFQETYLHTGTLASHPLGSGCAHTVLICSWDQGVLTDVARQPQDTDPVHLGTRWSGNWVQLQCLGGICDWLFEIAWVPPAFNFLCSKQSKHLLLRLLQEAASFWSKEGLSHQKVGLATECAKLRWRESG